MKSVYLFRLISLGACVFFFFKQKTAYEMRISDWSSDVCSSDLLGQHLRTLVLQAGDVAVEVPGIAVEQEGEIVGRCMLRGIAGHGIQQKIGRASCRERVCQYV